MKDEILIIEDDLHLQNAICKYLESLHFKCIVASSISEGKNYFERKYYPIVLLDLSLPDGDGLNCISFIKSIWEQTGIIIISAREKLEDRVDGLNLGADDYLVKPFHLPELSARVNALLRRNHKKEERILEFGEIKIDLSTQQVFIAKSEVEMRKKEYDILLYFIENRNRVITKESLFEHVWGENSVFLDHSDFIYTQMTRLRKKIKKYAGHDYIKTIYRFGYQLKIEE